MKGGGLKHIPRNKRHIHMQVEVRYALIRSTETVVSNIRIDALTGSHGQASISVSKTLDRDNDRRSDPHATFVLLTELRPMRLASTATDRWNAKR